MSYFNFARAFASENFIKKLIAFFYCIKYDMQLDRSNVGDDHDASRCHQHNCRDFADTNTLVI